MVLQQIDDPSVAVSIRPESIRLAPAPPPGAASGGDNCLAGRISGVTFLGASRRVDVVSDGVTLQEREGMGLFGGRGRLAGR